MLSSERKGPALMRSSQPIIVPIVIALVGLVTIVLSFSPLSQSRLVSAGRSSPSVLKGELSPYGLVPANDQNLEVEVVTLTEIGFDPPVITRPRGPFILALHNRTGERELVFRISRIQAEQVYEVRVRSGRRSQYQRLDLPLGSYVVSEVNHPAWNCALTITR